jgi:hypothetical protein
MRHDQSNNGKAFRSSGPKRSGPSEGVSHAYRPHKRPNRNPHKRPNRKELDALLF